MADAMVKWDPRELRKAAEADYEKAWLESAALLKGEGGRVEWGERKGRPHPVLELAWRLRGVILSYGFEEVLNPTMVDEAEIYRQYGPEAPAILDRCYYLATLPRPDVGLGRGEVERIARIVPGFNEDRAEVLRGVLRRYKEGAIEGDDLVEVMVGELEVRAEEATRILGLFPEFLNLTPTPTKLTLRSHMTALWFPVLGALQDRKPLPLNLFSVGVKFRREQRLDPHHLYESHVASLVSMREDISLKEGEELTRTILGEVGLKELRFEVKRATSKYYAPGMECEVFVRQEGGGWVEVGDQGLYSPLSLAQYDIKHPVFNLGLGVERIAMILHGVEDIRTLAYPQLYATPDLSDRDLAGMVRVKEVPQTVEGRQLMDAIVATAIKHAEDPSPCEVEAFRGRIHNAEVEVKLYEPDEGVKLLGPAALNTLYIHGGNILGIPGEGLNHSAEVREARLKGTPTGIRYLDAVASLAAYRVEKMAQEGAPQELELRVKVAKQSSDINVEVDRVAERFITGKRGKIMVKGPAFIGVKARLLK